MNKIQEKIFYLNLCEKYCTKCGYLNTTYDPQLRHHCSRRGYNAVWINYEWTIKVGGILICPHLSKTELEQKHCDHFTLRNSYEGKCLSRPEILYRCPVCSKISKRREYIKQCIKIHKKEKV